MAMGGAWLFLIAIETRVLLLYQGRTFLRLYVPVEQAACVVCHKQRFHEEPRDGPFWVGTIGHDF